jgi:hypothetical protein
MAHYRDLIVHPNPVIQQRWMVAAENEYGRLFQGFGDVEGMDVLEWIEKDLVPLSKVVTYARFTAAERAGKTNDTDVESLEEEIDSHMREMSVPRQQH